MTKKITFLMLGVLSLSVSVWALDKNHFADHVRKALNESSETMVTVEDPKPSDFGDLLESTVTLTNNQQKYQQKIFLTKDEKKYFWGAVFDLSKDPDKERLKMMDLKNAFYKGYAKAPVTIVEFSDLECEFCNRAHKTLEEELFKSYSRNDVRLVFKHFPLTMHQWAMDGAIAAECAGEQGNEAFWGMTNKFFDNAKTVTPENVKEKALTFAGDLKLNKSKLQTCMAGEAAMKRVISNRKEGTDLGVGSTPTFYVNGRMRRGFRDLSTLKPLIDEKLAEAKRSN